MLVPRVILRWGSGGYLGDAPHKGTVHRGEHEAIVPRELWDRVHAVLAEAPRTRAGQSRNQTPALLKGLIFGLDGRALSPSHTMRKGRQYRYYVLAPRIAEEILDGRQPPAASLASLMAKSPLDRTRQGRWLPATPRPGN